MHGWPTGARQSGILVPSLTDGETQALGLPVQCSFHFSSLLPWPGFMPLLSFMLLDFHGHSERFLKGYHPHISGLLRGQGQDLHCRSCILPILWRRLGASGLVQGGGVSAELWADEWSTDLLCDLVPSYSFVNLKGWL